MLHIGHQKILRAVVARARESGALAAVLTFDPHPLKVVRPQDSPPLLMTTHQRLAAFEDLSLDAALVLRLIARCPCFRRKNSLSASWWKR